MNLPEFSVKNPIKILMIFIGIFIIGIIALTVLPIDLMPEIEPPAITVIIQYEGASAEDVELTITDKVEKLLSTVNNIDEVSSISKEGVSLITCKFTWGTNLDEASNDIRDKLELTKKILPDETEDPIIFKFNTSNFPIAGFMITADQSYENIYDIVDDKIIDVLKRIPGVGSAMVMGAPQRQINIYLDKAKMDAYNISTSEIESILYGENVTKPAGNIKVGIKDYVIRVPGEFEKVSEIENVAVKIHNNKIVYMKDIAMVEDGYQERTRMVNFNKERRCAMFMVQRQSGANTVEVVKKVMAKIEEIKKTLPSDMKITNIFDSSDQILLSIDNLSSSVIWGGIAVILVVFFFLRQVRSSLIIILSIPFSLILSFIFLFAFNYTINMMSLSAIAIAIGMVVDNSIVVLENITKFNERGVKPREGSILGASEVGGAVTASTTTTIVIFFPLIFLTGVTGIIFKQLGAIIIITILASLFVSLTLTPMLSAKLLQLHSKEKSGKKSLFKNIYYFSEKIFVKIETVYSGFLGWSLKHKRIVVFAAILIFGLSFYLLKFIGNEFMPEQDTGDLRINFQLAEGTRVEETYKTGMKIVDFIYKLVPERLLTYMNCGKSETGMGAIMGMKDGTNIGSVGVKLVKQNFRERTALQIGNEIRKEIELLPEITKVDVAAGDPMGTILFGGGKPLTLEIRGDDIDACYGLAVQIKKIFQNVDGTGDVTISLDFGKPEITTKIDRSKAALLGLNTNTIAEAVNTYFGGTDATKYREKGKEYDIKLRLQEADRKKIRDVKEIPLKTLTGRQVELKEVAKVSEKFGPIEIRRIDQERVIKIESNVASRTLGELKSDIDKQIQNLVIPSTIALKWSGMVEEQRKSFNDLLLLLIVGIILVYMVMAGQYESLIDPFIIMFSVPFAFTGVIVALFLTGNSINIVSTLGLIMLVGIVVNNAIVLVDYLNILRARGVEMVSAIKQAGSSRLRPVLITTLTTIFGLVPLAISTGEGHEIWRPLGWALIGGLSISTLITLVLIPVIYSIVHHRIKNGNSIQVQR